MARIVAHLWRSYVNAVGVIWRSYVKAVWCNLAVVLAHLVSMKTPIKQHTCSFETVGTLTLESLLHSYTSPLNSPWPVTVVLPSCSSWAARPYRGGRWTYRRVPSCWLLLRHVSTTTRRAATAEMDGWDGSGERTGDEWKPQARKAKRDDAARTAHGSRPVNTRTRTS